MRKHLHVPATGRYLLLIFSFVFTFAGRSFAQDKTNTLQLVHDNLPQLGLSKTDMDNLYVADTYTDKVTGITMVYLQQQYKSINIHNALYTIAFKNGKVVSASSRFAKKVTARVNNEVPSITPTVAVQASAQHLGLEKSLALSPMLTLVQGKNVQFGPSGISKNNISVTLLWLPQGDSVIKLIWEVHIDPIGSADRWNIHIDAADGTVLQKENWTVYCQWNNPVYAVTDEPAFLKNANLLNPVKRIPAYTAVPALFGKTGFTPPATNNSAYLVIPYPVESPTHTGGTPSVQNNPWLLAGPGNAATTNGWHFDGTSDYNYTRGNNVFAQDDRNANNLSDGTVATSTTTFPDLNFNSVLNSVVEPFTGSNQPAAITNLFYWNNIMHDITYQYGFDEAAGNFQNDNLSRGGVGNDFVFADAQDGSGTDNANFSTPPDGSNGRMQMYLFAAAVTTTMKVNSPAAKAGNYFSLEGAMSTNNLLRNLGPVTGNVVLFNDDAPGTSHLGCGAAFNAGALSGNIALIDRGTCGFAVKVKDAQNAGAIAVIVTNNSPAAIVVMGGTDNTITIPAVMISQNDGDTLKAYLAGGVNVTLSQTPELDGDLDNGVISHEYTHGISTRLTGGPSSATCLFNAEQMGEGWSDFFALMVTTNWATTALTDGTKNRPLGTYVTNQLPTGPGIRTYPYTTNIGVNPWTYGMLATQTSGGEPHLVGEIWCATLWDMAWNIIAKDGVINPNLYDANAAGGNSVALKLVTLGLKLQPCGPGFLDGRDAILKADTLLYNGRYSCAIWQAFGRRGMGVNAKQGSANSISDQVQDFTLPSGAKITESVDKDTAAQGAILNYTVNVQCQCTPLSGLTIRDTLSSNVTYLSGGTLSGNEVSFSPINLTAQQSSAFALSVKIKNGTYSVPVTHITEPVASGTINGALWTTAALIGTTQFVGSSTRFNSAGFSFFAADLGTKTDFTITTANSYPLTGISTLSFWHYYNTEFTWDGGVVELSTDNGATWIDAGPYITTNGYSNNINPVANSALAARRAFTGSSGGVFINTIIDLTAFAGKSLQFRFRFDSDDNTGIEGWYVDDIQLTSSAGVINNAYFYNGATLLSNSLTKTIILSQTLPVVITDYTVTKQSNHALVQWQTAQEFNADKFEIERSTDGAHFSTIGTVKAAGNSDVPLHYQFTDILPANGINYYRLNEIDKDANAKYSPVKSLVFDVLGGQVIINPNPSKGEINVTIPAGAKNTLLHIIDSKGVLVGSHLLQSTSQLINLGNLAKGIYMLRIQINNDVVVKKLVIE